MRWYLFAVFSLVTATVHGQVIYGCSQSDGTQVLQVHPCPGAHYPRVKTIIHADQMQPDNPASPPQGPVSSQPLKPLKQWRVTQGFQTQYFPVGEEPVIDVSLPKGMMGTRPGGTPIQTSALPRPTDGLASPLDAGSAGVSSAACLTRSELNSTMTPITLFTSLANCISAGHYEEGVFLYAMAGSVAVFDQSRVADESSHGAIVALTTGALGSLPKDKVAAFQTRLKEVFGDDTKRGIYCKNVEAVGPPSYYPTYMIQYGLGAIAGGTGGQPLVVPFDSRTEWPKAVKEYLRCP